MRDCDNCVHETPNGCDSWECEYIDKEEAIKAWREKYNQKARMAGEVEYDDLKYLGDDITFCTAHCCTDCRRQPKYMRIKDRPHSFANFSANCMAYNPKERNGDD